MFTDPGYDIIKKKLNFNLLTLHEIQVVMARESYERMF